MQLNRTQRGFTLTEIAIAFLIISLLIAGAMMTLSAQFEQRNQDETLRRLSAAREALVAYAIVYGRLPCPATAGTTGDEAPAGGPNCTTWYGGFLPARTIGFQPTDAQGYGVDVWGNRIRYAVSSNVAAAGAACVQPTPFTSANNLRTNGVSCRPNDLDVCAPTVVATACNAANRVVTTQTAAFLVFSTGKNGPAAASYGAHEAANVDGDASFITRPPSGADSTIQTFDDLMVIVPAGVLYSRLIAAGILP